AADCTDAEDQVITDAYTAAASTSDCSEYASVSNLLVTIMPPCSSTACVSVMKQLAESISNCTTATYSEKDQLLQSLDICATPAPTPASTASSTNCTSDEAEAMFNAFYEAANGSCASSTTIEAYSIIIDTQCNSTCAAAVQSFAQTLPNCNYELSGENTNKKQDIATQFSYCEMLDDATNISVYVDSVDSLLGSSAGLAPVVPNCTTDENNETVDFFLAVATNESCQYDSSICAYDVHVNTDCDTECGRLVRRLGFDVPKCYFDHVNHREYLSDHWYQCEWIVNPDNISLSFHYSEIVLNATLNSSVACNPSFDSTVTSSDNDQDSSAASQTDSAALKSTTTAFIYSIALILATLHM
ncbi:hypothetical protein PHYSODRAFT_517543, partial [Phytophthora sojae]